LSKGFIHIRHLLLTLDALPMLAAHITRDGIQNALESISTANFSAFLKV
jgi:hypothetical protein